MVAVGKPRHPLGHALTDSNLKLDEFKIVFSNFIEENVASLARKNSETFKDTKNLTARIHGPIANFMLSAASQTESTQSDYNSKLTGLIELSYELCDFRLYRKSPSLVIPNVELARYALNETQVRSTLVSTNLKPVFLNLAIQLSESIERMLDEMARSEKKRRKLLIILAKIRLEILRRNIQQGCPILERKIELTPLKKLWTAWYTSKFG